MSNAAVMKASQHMDLAQEAIVRNERVRNESLNMLVAQIESLEPGERVYDAKPSRAEVVELGELIRRRRQQLQRELDQGW